MTMLKPIREETRETRMERALLVLEGMALDFCDDHTTSPGECMVGYGDKEYILALQNLASEVYCIAHAASGRCCEGGVSKWLDLIPEREQQLKGSGIMDSEELLSEPPKF